MKVLKIIKVIIVLDGIIGAIISNKKLNQRVTELFIRSKKLNISLVLLHKFILL